jgi:hypothetical protein
MGPSRFTSHPKEGVLRIFIALKNPSPWPDLNPGPLGLVASTLITAPPGRLEKRKWTLKCNWKADNVTELQRRLRNEIGI